jgi:hypothetical protein
VRRAVGDGSAETRLTRGWACCTLPGMPWCARSDLADFARIRALDAAMADAVAARPEEP